MQSNLGGGAVRSDTRCTSAAPTHATVAQTHTAAAARSTSGQDDDGGRRNVQVTNLELVMIINKSFVNWRNNDKADAISFWLTFIHGNAS